MISPTPCAGCEHAVYGTSSTGKVEPCAASLDLLEEINEIVSVKITPQENAEALKDFIEYPVNREMIVHLANKASAIVPQAVHDPHSDRMAGIPMLEYFIASVVERSRCQVSTLMTSLVFLARLKDRLPHIAQGLPCTRHRLFLASLILAAKYVNDSSPKNKHWSIYTNGVKEYPKFGFSLTEVNLMEKQLLLLLDWNLSITEEDLLTHFEPFLAQVRWDRAAVRLEEELDRRCVYIDPITQLPLPLPDFRRPVAPGTKAPTARDRESAHAVGDLFPDEELHLFLLSKLEKKPAAAKIFATSAAVPTIESDDACMLRLTASIEERDAQPHTTGEKHGMFRRPEADFPFEHGSMHDYVHFDDEDVAAAHATRHPVDMSRSSTQDSYLSSDSSRFASVSRDVTPASSLASLSGDDLDYAGHDDEDQADVFLRSLHSTHASLNPTPELHYQQYPVPAKAALPASLPDPGLRAPPPAHPSWSPRARAHGKQAGAAPRVSPTQGYTGIAKKGKATAESKSMARIRQTMQVYDADDGGRASKKSRFLPRFFGGAT